MKRVVMAAALAGLATGAWAQNVSTGLVVSVTFDRTTVAFGETLTATMTASWDGAAGSYLSSINIDLIAHGGGFQVSNVAPIAWANPALGWDGTPSAISGASIIGLQAAQFSLIPPFTSQNPILVTTFTLTRVSEAGLFYTAQAAAGAPFPFSVTGPVFNDPVVEFGVNSLVSDVLPGIPSPGAVAMLAMGGLVGVRRRR